MLPFTVIARESDGLPLVSYEVPSCPPDVKDKAREILGSIGQLASTRLCIDAGPYYFACAVVNGIVYVAAAERALAKGVAFSFLEQLAVDFEQHLTTAHGSPWHGALQTVDRPYRYVDFDPLLQQRRREFADPDARATASSRLHHELNEIHSFMTQNITDLLDRGRRLDNVQKASSRLVDDSKQFKWKASKLKWFDLLRRYAPYVIALLIVVFVIYFRFFW